MIVIKSGISLYFVTNEEAVLTTQSLGNIAKSVCMTQYISDTRRASEISFYYNATDCYAEINHNLGCCKL